MIHYKENLKKLYPQIGGNYDFTLESFIIDDLDEAVEKPCRPALLIFPGGAYSVCSEREGVPIAAAFAAKGFHCYVLHYSTASSDSSSRFPDQLLQAAAAIDYIKNKADEHGTDKTRIAVCGFSAGGHLAAMISTLYHHESIQKAFPNRCDDYFRPCASVLGYPVIVYNEKTAHLASFENLTGGDEKCKQALSLERCVTQKTPPAFIWHTSDDTAVDCRNSLEYASALREHGIKFELHVYASGPHGLSLANEVTCVGNPDLIDSYVANWVDDAARFLMKKG